MGCSNSNMEEVDNSRENIDNEPIEDDIHPIINKEKRQTNYSTLSSRSKKINLDPEVVNWRINTQNDLIHRLKSGNEKPKNQSIIKEEENEESNIIQKTEYDNAQINDENILYGHKNNLVKKEDNKEITLKANENNKKNNIKKKDIKNNTKTHIKNNIKQINKNDNNNDIDIFNEDNKNIKIYDYKINYNSENKYKDFSEKNKDIKSNSNTDRNSNKKPNKIYSNKKSPNKTKKEPFTIKTTKNDYGIINTIKINACYFLKEYLIPIWFEKDTCIKFTSKGKWRIDQKYEFTDSAGMPSPSTVDFNYGALVARIGFGTNFLIPPNESTFITKNDGPLYLKMNLPKKVEVKPEGTMEISIYDGVNMSIEEIYEKIGWQENNMKYAIKEPSELENNLIITFNNLRMNPILFYEINIKNNQNVIWTEDYLKGKCFNNIESINNDYDIKPFDINNDCYSILSRIDIKNFYTKNKFNKQKISIFLEELQEYLKFDIKGELMFDNYINCKLTKKIRPIDICIQYLLDTKFRNYIFNNKYNSISIKFIENYYEQSNLIIVAILKIEKEKNLNEKKNDEEEKDIQI